MKRFAALALLAAPLVVASGKPVASADDLEPKLRDAVAKGLEYLARTQHRDGHWEANVGNYPTTMTSLAGLAFLMEGSTIREGKYSDRIRRAADWLMERCQRNGLIGNPNNPTEAARYMYGHGFALLFLSQVYGEEEDLDRRKKLERILTKAVEFTGKAQSGLGGWYYTSAADGHNADEGSVTITQVQALRAARNAGIVVPKGIIDKAVKYLQDSTTPRGGVIYSLSQAGGRAMGGERAALTAAAVSCSFNAGEYTSEYAKKWLKFCQAAIPIDKSGRDNFGHWEYTHYYFSQAIYILGDQGYARLFPDSRPEQQLTWTKYRTTIYDYLLSRQNADGSWSASNIGPVYTTAVYLSILQLENGTLPIMQR
jgi:squalene cyclase